MAKFSTVLTTNIYADISGQIHQLFVDAALDGWTVGSLISGSNCKYFVLKHVSEAELYLQIPTNTGTRLDPIYRAYGTPSNHPFILLAAKDSVASMWTRVYTDSLNPSNAGFWADLKSTPAVLHPDIWTPTGDVDLDVYIRDTEDDFDMIWVTSNKSAIVGVHGAAIISSQLTPDSPGVLTWYGDSYGTPGYIWAVAINPVTGERAGVSLGTNHWNVNSFVQGMSVVFALSAFDTDTYVTQTAPLIISGRIYGAIQSDLLRFIKSTVVVRNEEWIDQDSGRKFISYGSGILLGNLTSDPVYEI